MSFFIFRKEQKNSYYQGSVVSSQQSVVSGVVNSQKAFHYPRLFNYV